MRIIIEFMKLEIRILALLLCATLASVACKKTVQPADEEILNPVGFRAMSQATWVDPVPATKADFPSTYDFGVWGIARHDQISSAYDLWGSTALTRASKNTVTQQYEPATAAYWLAGYKYTFLAIAPYTNSGVSNLTITPKVNQSAKDAISFTFDMANKYTGADYDFDLLGASAQTDQISGGHNASQDLTFWHLLSKISFELKFGQDAKGQQIDGTVNALSLSLKPEASYTISHDDVSAQSTATLHVVANPTETSAVTVPLSITTNGAKFTAGPINIVPQTPADLTLTVDFEINESETSSVDYSLEINLATSQVEKLLSNNRYNFRITIGASAAITFDVTVNQEWTESDKEIDMN